MTPREKFVGLIKNDILRMDLAELDFGIYRILNHRRRAVEQYLENTLPKRISASIAKLEGAQVNEEERIFAQLHTFFTRYYEDGDFVMKARRGRNAAYSVPYNGEDVHFHWASKGSHYVKSGLMFEHYRIKLVHGEQIVLAVDHAETPKDNNKSKDKRYFVPTVHAGDAATKEHRFTFQWRVLTDAEKKKYAAGKSKTKAVAEVGDEEEVTGGRDPQEKILNAWLAGQDFKAARVPASELDPDQLRPHAQRFVRKHEADFFVHPQLRSFLEGELDYFLKNEFIAIWDNDTWDDNAGALGREREKFKIAREIGLSLIRFLGEIEDVQAALFEKRRFVTRCDYLVQASAASATLRQSACENPAQVAEWAQWVGEKLAKPAKATAKQGETLLARYPHLPIHTRHFDDAFTLALLAEFPDLDAATGGTLIHSENYGALRTLEPTYRGQVKCIYIDPPYNTDAGPILYKNEFKESSWLSLIESRISASRVLMQPTGALCLTIDDFEVSRVTLELFDEFGEANHWATVAIRSKPQGRATTSGFSVNHEYALFFGNSETSQVGRLPREGSRAERYAHRDDRGAYTWANFRKTGSDSLHDDRRQQYYPIYVSGINARVPEMKWDGTRKEWVCKPPKDGETTVWPTDADNVARVWSVGADRAVSDLAVGDIEVRTTQDGVSLYRKYRPNEDGALPITWWADAKYSASESGTKLLQSLGLEPKDLFPKSVFAVSDCIRALGCGAKDFTLDYFGGSGTTGHAVINLNREDGGTRKFLLVEMGDYFDTVMLPRIAKVMTSPEWKDGKPKEGVVREAVDDEHWSARTLPVVKVLRLESYDDALNAIELEKDEAGNVASLSIGVDSREADGTLIRYVLGAAREENTPQPVWLNTEALDKPFGYALPTVVNGVASTLNVDLTETACLMLGMQAVRIRAAEREVAAKGSSKSSAQRFRLVEGWLPQEGNKLALLVLRDYVAPKNGDEAKAEYEWLKKTVAALFGHALADYAKLYYNRDMVFMGNEKFECVDGLMKRRMMERASV